MIQKGKKYKSVNEFGELQEYEVTRVDMKTSVLVVLVGGQKSTIVFQGDIGAVQHIGVSFSKYFVTVSELEMLNEVIKDIEESLCELE